jgi:hypothetical protein
MTAQRRQRRNLLPPLFLAPGDAAADVISLATLSKL